VIYLESPIGVLGAELKKLCGGGGVRVVLARDRTAGQEGVWLGWRGKGIAGGVNHARQEELN